MDNSKGKKRNRVPLSCSVCRKRKSRCDRVKPVCGSCKLKSIAHLCFYDVTKNKVGDEDTKDGEKVPMLTESPNYSSPNLNYSASIGTHVHGTYSYNPSAKLDSHESGKWASAVVETHNSATNLGPLGDGKAIEKENGMSEMPSMVHLLSDSFADPTQLSSRMPTRPAGFNYMYNTNTSQIPFPPPPVENSDLNLEANDLSAGEAAMLEPTITPRGISSSRRLLNSSTNLMPIELGLKSVLMVNPDDIIDVFSGASCSLLIEGIFWQQQGQLSYIGLTKSDPFFNIFRSYAIRLFRSGEFSQFTASSKKRKNSQRSGSSLRLGPEKKSKRSSGSSNEHTLAPADLYDNKAEANSETNSTKPEALSVKSLNSDTLEEDMHDGISAQEETDNALDEEGDVDVDYTLVLSRISNNNLSSHNKEFLIPRILPGIRSFYQGKPNERQYLKLVENIVLRILPSSKTLFMLFHRFFKFVSPFIPILDETSLQVDLNQIFPEHFPKFEGKYRRISINNMDDLNTLAAFLLVIRLGYFCLTHNNSSYDIQNKDELTMISEMKKIGDDDYASLVDLCVPNDTKLQRSSFKLVQNLTLIYFSRGLIPNDSYGISGTDSQVLFGDIVRHAFAIGLNRDPSTYLAHASIYANEPLTNTWRNLWDYITSSDVYSAIGSGTTLNIPDMSVSDVKLPSIQSRSGELREINNKKREICSSYRRIVSLISNVREKPKVIDILSECSQLENIFLDFFGKEFFNDLICGMKKSKQEWFDYDRIVLEHEECICKVLKFMSFVELRTNLSCLYYKIAIYYEMEAFKSNEVSMAAGIELFKIYITCVVQLVFIMSYVIDNSVLIFGRNFDYILTAYNERCMIKTHCLLSAFFVRMIHYRKEIDTKIEKNSESKDVIETLKLKMDVIDKLFVIILNEAELFVGNIRKLSRRYNNSFKLHVMTYYILKQCMENPDVFFEHDLKGDIFYNEQVNMLEILSVEELQNLCKLCEEFMVAKNELELLLRLRKEQEGKTEHSTKSSNDSYEKKSSNYSPNSTLNSDFNFFGGLLDFQSPDVQGEDILRFLEMYVDCGQELWSV